MISRELDFACVPCRIEWRKLGWAGVYSVSVAFDEIDGVLVDVRRLFESLLNSRVSTCGNEIGTEWKAAKNIIRMYSFWSGITP